ncbi:glycosyltransferase involved in cell wall biosynthesis [Gelidibacter sediminis]|uniref:Glycosyltransferase involved in cell wall biosynthesis n=2 Tax=Gelidibacter sediminis TaxID=1608710 RepID=A0A4R7PYD7_9FLAO|nr:glycosyltransferase involved in cell wall biosynthesis [Gelidibacter sediminis]
MEKKKIIRITTIPGSMLTLLKGQLKYMSEFYEIIGVSSQDPYLSKLEDQENIRTHAINMTRNISPLKDLKSAYQLYKYLKREKPFLVHTHTPKAGTLGMLAARLAGVPNRLHTVAGLPLLEATGRKRNLLNVVEKITYANATLIIPNSTGLQEIIKKNKFASDNKLKIIGNGSSNGIDTEYFNKANIDINQQENLKTQLNISNDEFVFIYVGRLVADKGINELVHAFNSVSNANKKTKLLLVGIFESNLDPLNTETLKEIEQNNNIIYVEWQSDVRPYFAISNALVFPSYREGFPNVVMQAGAMELACIVTDINGCNEIISHKNNGLIIAPKSKKELQNAMQYLIDNPADLAVFSSNARDNIIAKYKKEIIWDSLLNLYRSLEF